MAARSTDTPWRALLHEGRADGRLVHDALEGARRAVGGPLPGDLDPRVRAALERRGVTGLYRHQAQALEHARAGRSFVVTTSTASGKSLCFQLPLLEALHADPRDRAILLYPTKALAQDQFRALHGFGVGDVLRPAIYDGDTPRERRRDVRRRANVLLTNPDMLHVGIVPRHDLWADALRRLRWIVVDEAHVYRGVFGSHVANVLRRLLRVARIHGADPQVALATATIANPVGLARELTGRDDIALVDEDGAPAAAREVAMWNPPVLDPATQERESALQEGAEVLARLVGGGARAICFMKSRKGVEWLARITAEKLREEGRDDLAGQVTAYRAGYTPEQRRDLERRLVAGELRCVVATNALELGIDVGELDACVVVTFPGTIASLRQMWGRAGRRGRGLAVYVAGEDALDQFLCRHPEQLLERPVEAAILRAATPSIHVRHLLCAAHEAPLVEVPDAAETLGPGSPLDPGPGAAAAPPGRADADAASRPPRPSPDPASAGAGRSAEDEPAPAEPPRGEARELGRGWRAQAQVLLEQGLLVRRRGALHPRHPGEYPAAGMGLRGGGGEQVVIVDHTTGEQLGDVEPSRAPHTVHEGAVYLHLGERYEVQALDLERGVALVEPFSEDWSTRPKVETDVHVEALLERRDARGVEVSLGTVTVTDTVIAYQRFRPGGDPIDLRTLDLPETRLTTEGIWICPDPVLARDFPMEILLGSLHAVEHTQIAVLPLLAMCDRWDIGGLSTNLHPQTSGSAIFVHEAHEGGVGIARQAYARYEELCANAHRLLAECPCAEGCPSCVQSPKCGNLNEPLHKAGAIEVLERLVARA